MRRGVWALLAAFGACATPSSEVAPSVQAPPPEPAVAATAPAPELPPAPAEVRSSEWKPPPALDAEPAAVPMPAAPPLQAGARRGEAPARDQAGELERNASVSGRLPEPGHRAAFPFRAEAGEQSLFELAGTANSRGGSGRVHMTIEDSAGKIVWQNERDVGVLWRDFAAFTPPQAGEWTYTLTIVEGGYRFVLVRHSNYAPLDGEALDLGARASVHGHLPDGRSVARFLVPVAAGEELAVKVVGTREEARVEARRGATDMNSMMARMEPMRDSGRMAGASKLQFQVFDLEVTSGATVLGAAGPYLRFKAPEAGAVEVRVRARRPAAGGGLFDLAVERPLTLVHVRGVVVDGGDRPLADVGVQFLREPDADPVGSARTDAEGAFEATVLGGDLSIVMVHEGRAARDAVRVHVEEDAEFDLLFEPGAKTRGQ